MLRETSKVIKSKCSGQWRESVCGSWEKGSHIGDGGARPSRKGNGAAVGSRVEEKGRSNMATETGNGLATASRDEYAQSECYCALYSNCIAEP